MKKIIALALIVVVMFSGCASLEHRAFDDPNNQTVEDTGAEDTFNKKIIEEYDPALGVLGVTGMAIAGVAILATSIFGFGIWPFWR